jgi:hypothetical protein
MVTILRKRASFGGFSSEVIAASCSGAPIVTLT